MTDIMFPTQYPITRTTSFLQHERFYLYLNRLYNVNWTDNGVDNSEHVRTILKLPCFIFFILIYDQLIISFIMECRIAITWPFKLNFAHSWIKLNGGLLLLLPCSEIYLSAQQHSNLESKRYSVQEIWFIANNLILILWCSTDTTLHEILSNQKLYAVVLY